MFRKLLMVLAIPLTAISGPAWAGDGATSSGGDERPKVARFKCTGESDGRELTLRIFEPRSEPANRAYEGALSEGKRGAEKMLFETRDGFVESVFVRQHDGITMRYMAEQKASGITRAFCAASFRAGRSSSR